MGQGIQVRANNNNIIIDTTYRLPRLKVVTTNLTLNTTNSSQTTATEPAVWRGAQVYHATSSAIYWGFDPAAATEFELLITDKSTPPTTDNSMASIKKLYVLRWDSYFRVKLETNVWTSCSFVIKGIRY